jgi:hypothetical protein
MSMPRKVILSEVAQAWSVYLAGLGKSINKLENVYIKAGR